MLTESKLKISAYKFVNIFSGELCAQVFAGVLYFYLLFAVSEFPSRNSFMG